ncbi:MAG: transglutaminase domain-containing protein [Acidobacteria bacterium OLB17]|nr:MAG: transglutaminase domain-containing protein [Acidobacteria bacterium OLB17]MCZ2390273.1 DUF3857 and transglutaminase domain-containing protein [Acidobacteriota bacterium]
MRIITHLKLSLFLAAILAFGLVGTAFAFDDAPDWVRQAAGSNIPTYDIKNVPAVVLLDEYVVSVDSSGRISTTSRYALKILTNEGRRLAIARGFYLTTGSKVTDIDAWVIPPAGSVQEFGKKSVIDMVDDADDVYNEGRVKVIDATDSAAVGAVFAYSVTTEESPLFYQDQWAFQGRLPVLRSRYSLQLPSGWTATSFTFNAPDLKPQVNGSTYTWEMTGLKPITWEPMSPSVANLAPRIAVNYGETNVQGRSFPDWKTVSTWATPFYDSQVIVDDAVAGKARELTANAKTELEMIRAIGTFVQNLQYISIDIGVGYGNGYKPRPSSTVLARGYGDCKDKANLMRAMLKALKIDAYPIVIYSGDPNFVREAWPSPKQFNHCIIAVRVSDAVKSPAVLTDPKLGRLLIFDATDSYTPVGDLPDYLQNSLAVIIAGENGGLLRMPLLPADENRLERTLSVSLSPTGDLKGSIRELATGQTSTVRRTEFRSEPASEYKKDLERWLTRASTAAKLIDYKASDEFADAAFDLKVDFTAPSYGQLMQSRLMTFKPAFVGRRSSTAFSEPKRIAPISIGEASVAETATFDLPEGFVVDETPEALDLKTEFGTYRTDYKVNGRQLVYTRHFQTKRSLIPAEKYAEVRAFFGKIRDAEQSPVVLIKQ